MSLNLATAPHSLRQITQEWNDRRYSDAARHRFDEWTAQHPVLRGYELAEIPYRVSTLPRAEADAILHSLISLSQEGHSLAGLCILATFSPRIIRLVDHPSVQGQFADINDRFAHVIVAAWEAIGTYNTALTSKVVANFAMGMLKHAAPYAARKIARNETCVSGLIKEAHLENMLAEETTPAPPSAKTQVDVILTWAEEKQVVSADDIDLIRDYYLTFTGHEARLEMASLRGISRDALYQRVHRILARLQTAVATHIERSNIS